MFVEGLRSILRLNVWVVIRLCTDEDKVVRFYNEIDEDPELELEVLDDLEGEAKEVKEHNPWLNYSLPLHRLREFGNQHKVLDLIDERPLSDREIREFCCVLFGQDNTMERLPDASLNWPAFVAAVSSLQKQEKMQWNPITKRLEPWINIQVLKNMKRSCTCFPF
jgi:hypothetical protein